MKFFLNIIITLLLLERTYNIKTPKFLGYLIGGMETGIHDYEVDQFKEKDQEIQNEIKNFLTKLIEGKISESMFETFSLTPEVQPVENTFKEKKITETYRSHSADEILIRAVPFKKENKSFTKSILSSIKTLDIKKDFKATYKNVKKSVVKKVTTEKYFDEWENKKEENRKIKDKMKREIELAKLEEREKILEEIRTKRLEEEMAEKEELIKIIQAKEKQKSVFLVLGTEKYELDENNQQLLNDQTKFETHFDQKANNGFAITIDQKNLDQIKKYYMSTILSLFKGIDFDIEFYYDKFFLDKLKIDIPLDLINDFEDNRFKIEFNDEDECIDVIFQDLPVEIEIAIKIKAKSADGQNTDQDSKSLTKGKLYIAGIFQKIRIGIYFQEDKEKYFFKPKLYMKLKDWDVNIDHFKFFVNLRKAPDFLIKGILSKLKGFIFEKLEENIKWALPESVTPMLNDLIDYYYPKNINILEIPETISENKIQDDGQIQNEVETKKIVKTKVLNDQGLSIEGEATIRYDTKNIGLNILMTKVPLIKDKRLSLYMMGNFIDFSIKSHIKEDSVKKEILEYSDFEQVHNIQEFYERNLCFQKAVERTEKEISHNIQITLNPEVILNFLRAYFSKPQFNTFSFPYTFLKIEMKITLVITMDRATIEIAPCGINLEKTCLVLKNGNINISNVNKVVNKNLDVDIMLILQSLNLSGIESEGKIGYAKAFLEIVKVEVSRNTGLSGALNSIIKNVDLSVYLPTVIEFSKVVLPMGINLEATKFNYFYKKYNDELKVYEDKEREEFFEIGFDYSDREIFLFANLKLIDYNRPEHQKENGQEEFFDTVEEFTEKGENLNKGNYLKELLI